MPGTFGGGGVEVFAGTSIVVGDGADVGVGEGIGVGGGAGVGAGIGVGVGVEAGADVDGTGAGGDGGSVQAKRLDTTNSAIIEHINFINTCGPSHILLNLSLRISNIPSSF